MTRFVLDIDDSQWKADHLPRVLRTTESEWLNELACQVEIQIADARPLIVLDLDFIRFAAYGLRDVVGILRRDGLDPIADQIEAQTKPARIPEPGLWGVVEATSAPYSGYRTQYVHRGGSADPAVHWARVMDGDLFGWADLIDPTLIRDGVA